MGNDKVQVPAPHYALFNTSKGDDPAVVVVNSSLRLFRQKEAFPWHLSITINFEMIAEQGMPTAEENKVLNQLEDLLFDKLLSANNAAFLSRVTCRGVRDLGVRVSDPEVTNTILQELLSSPRPLRQWSYTMKKDSDWVMARPVFALLDQAGNVN